MAKYDAVDQLMRMATDKPKQPEARRDLSEAGEANAATVLEARVTATEPGLPERAVAGPKPPPANLAEPDRAAPFAAARDRHLTAAIDAPLNKETALAQPHVSAGERGRQLLGALRPFLPVVGGALRMVDHGAVQAVARLLPLLGGMGAAVGTREVAEALNKPAPEPPLLEKRYTQMAEELQHLQAKTVTLEGQMKRLRDSLDRTITEQGSQAHRMLGLGDRSRLLTAAVIILFMLVAAEMILLGIFMHR